MSCPQEPTTEDAEYKCRGKGTGQNGNCMYSFWMPKDKDTGNQDRCETCVTIDGVISALETLVCWEPWWEKEGKTGQPHKEAWELAGLEEEKEAKDKDENEAAFGDGMTTKERREFRRKMEHHFLSTQGSGITEEEMLAAAVSGPTFYSSSSTLVGEEWAGGMDDGQKEAGISAMEFERFDQNSVW